tara:strand:+ start:1377 stop:1679 length:303 start_codon:yes stop_codon:yes gene_type:complete
MNYINKQKESNTMTLKQETKRPFQVRKMVNTLVAINKAKGEKCVRIRQIGNDYKATVREYNWYSGSYRDIVVFDAKWFEETNEFIVNYDSNLFIMKEELF